MYKLTHTRKKKKGAREETLKDMHQNNMYPCFGKTRDKISCGFYDFFFL